MRIELWNDSVVKENKLFTLEAKDLVLPEDGRLVVRMDPTLYKGDTVVGEVTDLRVEDGKLSGKLTLLDEESSLLYEQDRLAYGLHVNGFTFDDKDCQVSGGHARHIEMWHKVEDEEDTSIMDGLPSKDVIQEIQKAVEMLVNDIAESIPVSVCLAHEGGKESCWGQEGHIWLNSPTMEMTLCLPKSRFAYSK